MSAIEPNAATSAGLPPFIRITLRIWLKVYAGALGLVRPWFDLLVRIVLAQALLGSALVKLADWDNALALATYEYPVPWMAPASAAMLGLTIELASGIMLLLGFGTRVAALAVTALLAVSQVYYIPIDLNLFSIALLVWLAVAGAGGLSLDRLIANGFGKSALPLAAPLAGLGARLTRFGGPIWALAARVWLGVTLLIAAGPMESAANALFFPSGTYQPLLGGAAVLLAVLAVAGLAMPLVSALLVTLLAGTQIMGYHPSLSTMAMLFSASFVFFGSGALSLDRMIGRWLENHVLFDRRPDKAPASWPHVVVVGGGFGGLACVSELRKLPVRVTLIDRHNYHLFQPLLYQVATAALSPADVATPIRSLYREDGNVRVLMGTVDRVDAERRQIGFGENRMSYDWLVLATGATHSYFGRDEWAPFAPGLKRIEDGVAVRARVLSAFERAEAESDESRIDELLTFVIVGAGPTGVELAGAIAELARHGLQGEFRRIDLARTRILLVQSADRILPAFPEKLSRLAAQSLESLGVEIRVRARVTLIAGDHVMVGDERIAAGTVLWAAGVRASAAGEWLGSQTDQAGRVFVDDHLRVTDHADILAIGDTASSNAWNGQPVPGLAPAAKQAGKYVAKVIRAELEGQSLIAPFAYKHQGSLATIGRKSAVADFGWIKLSGAPAWWLWGAVHVGFLVGVRNRITVLVNWGWNYMTMRLGIRLITGQTD